MPRAGALNKRVTFQKEITSDDGGGGTSIDWVTQFTLWGSLLPERGRERLAADRVQAEVAGVLRVRMLTQAKTVTTAWRAVIDSVPYQIRSITNPDQRGKYLEMVVERGVGQ